jgi:PilZ domain-containing protein
VVAGPVTAGPDELTYLVLTDRAAPYLLARVRWPDVAQAITVGNPDWLDDPGLFDLPYEPSAVGVSFAQATSVAAGWGRQLSAEAADGVPSFMRRMPANWSSLSPAERHAYGLDSIGRRRVSGRRLRRLRSSQPKIGVLVPPASPSNGQVAGLAGALGPVATERRRHVRVPVDGRAHILWEGATIPVGLVDLSEGGVQCVLPEAARMLAPGAVLGSPFLLEAEVTTARLCLDLASRISWNHSITTGTHFGVVFGDLADGETEGVHRFLVAASSRRGSR